MSQKKLTTDLKEKNFSSCYLLYGEESFLVSHYAAEIEKAIFPTGIDPLFRDIFEEKAPSYDIIIAAETLPFLAEKKLVLVRSSGLFESGRKDDSAAIAEYISKIPSTSIIVFTENKVDKRNKLFKEVAKLGFALECTTPTPGDLSRWVMQRCKKKGAAISPAAANFFVSYVDNNMWTMANEIDKVTSFSSGEITIEDIKSICTPTLESKVFELINAMFKGQTAGALEKYRNMLLLKDSPIGILSLIARQFKILLIAKCAKKSGMTISQTALEFKLHDFAVSQAFDLSGKFTEDQLITALEECLELDVKMKTGLMEQELGVEVLIIKYSSLL